MAGRNDHRKRWKIGSETLKDFPENFFFAGVRAPAEKNRPVAVDAERPQDLQRKIGVQPDVQRIVFDAPDVVDAFTPNTERDPTFHVFGLLDADRVETTERRRDERTKTMEARFGPIREPRIDQRERDPPVARFRGEIWPDFGFDQNDADWPNEGEGASRHGPKIQRTIKNFDSLVRFGVCHLKPRRSRCREDAKEFRIELAKLRAQFQSDGDFADANGVDPRAAMGGQPSAHFAVVGSKTLPQFVPIISAPEELRDLAGKKKEQADRVKKIVEKTDHRVRNSTSVAP